MIRSILRYTCLYTTTREPSDNTNNLIDIFLKNLYAHTHTFTHTRTYTSKMLSYVFTLCARVVVACRHKSFYALSQLSITFASVLNNHFQLNNKRHFDFKNSIKNCKLPRNIL